jgi:hypothetical protein
MMDGLREKNKGTPAKPTPNYRAQRDRLAKVLRCLLVEAGEVGLDMAREVLRDIYGK